MPENARPSRTGRLWRMIGSSATLVAITVVALWGAGPSAAAEPFRIEFDQNRIEIGPVDGLPIGQIASGASIEGTVDSQGRVSIPRGKFTLPVLGIDEPVEVRGFMGIEEDATGTWDPMTGKLELQARAGIWLSIDVAGALQTLQSAGVDIPDLGPLQFIIGSIGDLTCGFSPIDVTFTTETTAFGTGQRFTRGLDGPGVLTAGWSRLGPFAGRTGAGLSGIACPLVRSLIPSLLTGLVGNSIPGLDLGGLDLGALLENLDNVDLGPSSLTISRTVDESIPASVAMVAPRAAIRARAGRPARIAIRVSNPGDYPATGVRICPRIPRSARASGSCTAIGVIAPRRSVKRTLVIRPKRSNRSGKRAARKTRTVRISVVVTGAGIPARTRGMVLRVVG